MSHLNTSIINRLYNSSILGQTETFKMMWRIFMISLCIIIINRTLKKKKKIL